MIARVEAAVDVGFAADKSAAVAVALERWLDGFEPMVNMGSGATSGAATPLPADPGSWSVVTSAADVGSLVAVAEPELFSPGDVAVVERTGERVRVRGVDDGVLAVDRGFGAAIQNGGYPPSAIAIRLGDRVVVVERAAGDALEAPVPDGLEASPAGTAGGDGAVSEAGMGEPSGPGRQGGQAGSGPVPAPPDSEEALALEVAGVLEKPVAVARRYVAAGRVRRDRGTLVLDGERL